MITSDIIDMPTVDTFFMFDVLHHISRPRDFFKEAIRCLRNSGRIIMIEPANRWMGMFQAIKTEKGDR